MYAVLSLPVLDTTVYHVFPLSSDRSTSYPVIAEPPSFAGAAQDKLICDDEMTSAASSVGEDGTVTSLGVVVDAVFDGELVPTEFIAETRYV